MAAATLHNCIAAVQLDGCSNDYASLKELRNPSLRFISKGFAVDVKLLSNRICSSNQYKMHVIHASSSHASVVDPVLSTSHSTTNNNQKKSSEPIYLILSLNFMYKTVDLPYIFVFPWYYHSWSLNCENQEWPWHKHL